MTYTLVPTDTKVTVEIPREYVNREILIDVRLVDDDDDARRRQELHDFFMQHQVDLSDFKFDRDEANER